MNAITSAPDIRRLWRTLGFALVAMVVVLSLAPVSVDLPARDSDKLGHALAYAVLMGWFAQLHRHAGERRLLALAFVALGIAIESAQGFLPPRQFSVADMLANAVGVALGWLAAPPRIADVLTRLEGRIAARAGASGEPRR